MHGPPPKMIKQATHSYSLGIKIVLNYSIVTNCRVLNRQVVDLLIVVSVSFREPSQHFFIPH